MHGLERRRFGVARRDGDLDARRGLAGFAARDGEGPALLGPRDTSRPLGGVEAGGLGGPHGVVPEVRIANPRRAHGLEQLDGHLVGNEFVVRKSLHDCALLSPRPKERAVMHASPARAEAQPRCRTSTCASPTATPTPTPTPTPT